jgi:valyl-tRNA synthetase
MPYITEELWLAVCAARGIQSESIMIERLPDSDQFTAAEATEAKIEWLKSFIVAIRQMRGEMNIKPSMKLRAVVAKATQSDASLLEEFSDSIAHLAGVTDIEHVPAETEVPEAATIIVSEMRVMIPLVGVIDVAGELARLEKQFSRNSTDISKLAAKLDNPGFTAKAPPEVVAKDRDRLVDLRHQNAAIADRLEVLRELHDPAT